MKPCPMCGRRKEDVAARLLHLEQFRLQHGLPDVLGMLEHGDSVDRVVRAVVGPVMPPKKRRRAR